MDAVKEMSTSADSELGVGSEDEEDEGFPLCRGRRQLMNDNMKVCSQHAAGGAEGCRMGSAPEGKWAPQAPLRFKHSEYSTARHHGRTERARADGGPVYVFIED